SGNRSGRADAAASGGGESRMPRSQQGTGARHADAVCQRRRSARRESRGVVVLPELEWPVEIQLGAAAGIAAGGFLPRRLRRKPLEGNPGAVQLADSRLRHAVLSEQWLHLQEELALRAHGAAGTI